MDVSSAFLHGELSETLYMKFPKGYYELGSMISLNMVLKTTAPSLICLHRKSLYGLRQDPHFWFSKLSSALLNMGYEQSKADYNLFSKMTLLLLHLF